MEIRYQDHYNRALNLAADGNFKKNLLTELRTFLKLSQDDETLYQICKDAPQAILNQWQEQKIDPKNVDAVTSFYVKTNLYCYELVALEIDATEARQEQVKEIADLLKRNKKRIGCDYGSGIGTFGIYLNSSGLQCDFADVSRINLDFIAQRLASRGMRQSRYIHLMSEKLQDNAYDFISAQDVIEHVADPLALMIEMTAKLREGGLLIFNLLYHDELNTPHILMDPNPIRKNIRGLGLRKVCAIGEFKVYQKVRRPEWANAMCRWLDTVFWDLKGKTKKKGG